MKRLFASLALVMLFLLSFPALSAQESRNIIGATSVAYAGHTIPTMRDCVCGTQNCICDTGEPPCTSCPQGRAMQSPDEPEALDVDAGAGLTLLVAAVLLVLRLRHIS